MKRVLVTGGAGYIGSHTCVELLNAGHEVTVYDNFSNSHPSVLDRISQITNKSFVAIKGDIRDQELLEQVIKQNSCEVVIHFAGLKAVNESVQNPIGYYDNNVIGTLSLLKVMSKSGLNTIVFSSSATVYGEPQYLPLDEKHPLSATNPYGSSKLFIEEILRDCHKAENAWKIMVLRYFNPVGAHESGLLGESPNGTPNNLMPYIAQVAVGKLEKLHIYGNDYPTQDGTGIRDYIHVMDLARGHLKAIEKLDSPQYSEVNLGTGKGYSVLEIVKTFEEVSGKSIPYTFEPRRTGDVASCFANPSKARTFLDWEAQYSLTKMCSDHWLWQSQNPSGYL